MSENLDKSTIRVLKNAFGAFDPLNTGSIKSKDVGTILEMLGHKMDDKSVAKIVAEADKDNSGELDFDEFCAFAAKYVEVEEDLSAAARDLKEAFRLYDREGNGYLTVQVLRQILHELDDKLTNEELDMMIDEIDADGSGTVDFDEFMNVMIG